VWWKSARCLDAHGVNLEDQIQEKPPLEAVLTFWPRTEMPNLSNLLIHTKNWDRRTNLKTGIVHERSGIRVLSTVNFSECRSEWLRLFSLAISCVYYLFFMCMIVTLDRKIYWAFSGEISFENAPISIIIVEKEIKYNNKLKYVYNYKRKIVVSNVPTCICTVILNSMY
jgi:hypothetical protein